LTTLNPKTAIFSARVDVRQLATLVTGLKELGVSVNTKSSAVSLAVQIAADLVREEVKAQKGVDIGVSSTDVAEDICKIRLNTTNLRVGDRNRRAVVLQKLQEQNTDDLAGRMEELEDLVEGGQ
jgi:hypothetical protein